MKPMKWCFGIWGMILLGIAGCDDKNADADAETDGITEARSDAAYNTAPSISDADYQTHIDAVNNFGFSLLSNLTAGDAGQGNLVYSPVSVAIALDMAYVGAKGDTATQMATALGNTLSDDLFFAAGNRLLLDLAARNIAPHASLNGGEGELEVVLSPANAIWAQNGYPLETSFLDILSIHYDAGVKLMDFISNPDGSRGLINDWVSDKTEEKIQNLLPPGSISSDTRVVLTNALYFYGNWAVPFTTEQTTDGSFNTLSGGSVTVPLMHQTIQTTYGQGDGYQLVNLPYDGNALLMTLVMPDAGRFEEIRDGLTADGLAQYAEAANTGDVAVTLPRFRFDFGTLSLKESLQSLGMVDAFDSAVADFTGLNANNELYIGDVVHKAFIGVDEYGTEAAAATAVIFDTVSIGPDPVIFTADRPFIFFIRDTNGLILFSGQVADPSL